MLCFNTAFSFNSPNNTRFIFCMMYSYTTSNISTCVSYIYCRFYDYNFYFLMFDLSAGLSHTMKVDNSSIERVEEFKYLGTTLTNQDSVQKEIKSRLKLVLVTTRCRSFCLPVCYPKI